VAGRNFYVEYSYFECRMANKFRRPGAVTGEAVQYNNPLMDRDLDKRDVRLEITEHIFGNAPTMLALCLTTVGLIKIYTALQRITTLADDFLVLCLAAFLLATIFSYAALRSKNAKRRAGFAKLADVLFISGLSAATIVAFFVVYALAG
jgi:hypothetical protein